MLVGISIVDFLVLITTADVSLSDSTSFAGISAKLTAGSFSSSEGINAADACLYTSDRTLRNQ